MDGCDPFRELAVVLIDMSDCSRCSLGRLSFPKAGDGGPLGDGFESSISQGAIFAPACCPVVLPCLLGAAEGSKISSIETSNCIPSILKSTTGMGSRDVSSDRLARGEAFDRFAASAVFARCLGELSVGGDRGLLGPAFSRDECRRRSVSFVGLLGVTLVRGDPGLAGDDRLRLSSSLAFVIDSHSSSCSAD